jgi:thiamine pyrophosphokinase
MEDIITVEKIAVITSGYIEDYSLIKSALQNFDQYVAIKGGLEHCARLDILPIFFIGDIDSLEPSVKKKFPKLQSLTLPKDQKHTTLERTIDYLMQKNPKSITIFGGMERRIDHSLFHILLLSRYPGKLFIESENEILCVIDKSLELATAPGELFSLIPLNGPVQGVSTDGLKWDLADESLDKHHVSISNEAVADEITISVKSGDLLLSVHKPHPRTL